MKDIKVLNILSKTAFFIFVVLVVYFVYYGLANSIQGIFEGDSIIFHIPIAQQLAKFTFMPADLTMGLGYLPATAEAILSVFILLHLPLNLFNVLGLICLFIAAKKVAESFGLSKEMSIIYAVGLSTLQSVLRWPLTQVSDIWLAVFFLAVLYLLKVPKKNNKYFLSLGFFTGMLVGAKSSGLIFAALLLVFFGINVFKKIKVSKIIFFAVPLLLFGFSWYIRNYILTGNPMYPVGIFTLAGDPEYLNLAAGNWSIFANTLQNPAYIIKVANALISEFFVWASALVLPVYVLAKKRVGKDLKKLSIVAIVIFLAFIFTFPAESVVSNMRHIYPLMAIVILQAFMLFEKKQEEVAIFATLSCIFPLMNLGYHPKILILALIPAFYFIFINTRLFDKVKEA